MWTIFKVFIEFVTILFLFSFFLNQGMGDLNPLTSDWTHSPCVGSQNLNHWTAREVPTLLLLICIYIQINTGKRKTACNLVLSLYGKTRVYAVEEKKIFMTLVKGNKEDFTQGVPTAMYWCHVWMWELDHKESWALKNWCFWTVVLEKTLESPWDCKEIQLVNPKGSQSWIFFGRTDAEAEAPILWPPDAKSWFIGKDPDTEKDWWQEEKGVTEDEMVGSHHWLNEYGFE